MWGPQLTGSRGSQLVRMTASLPWGKRPRGRPFHTPSPLFARSCPPSTSPGVNVLHPGNSYAELVLPCAAALGRVSLVGSPPSGPTRPWAGRGMGSGRQDRPQWYERPGCAFGRPCTGM